MHQVQAGVAAHECLLRLAAQNICPVFTGAVQTCQITVVAGILAVDHTFLRVGQNAEHIADQIQLQLAGLAAGHIQVQIFVLQLLVARHHFLEFDSKLFTASARIGCQFYHPFWISLGYYMKNSAKMQEYIASNFIFHFSKMCFQ